MDKFTEIEAKVKVTKEEFSNFVITNRFFSISPVVEVKHDEYAFYDDGIILRSRTTRHVALDTYMLSKPGILYDSILDGFENFVPTETIGQLIKNSTEYCTKKKLISNGVESNVETTISFHEAQELLKRCSGHFSKFKTALQTFYIGTDDTVEHLNLEFVHVRGIDGVYAELEIVNPEGFDDKIVPTVKEGIINTIKDLGFTTYDVEPRTWKELLSANE